MKRALVVTREVNKPNGYDVFLSYHPGDGPMRKRWALSTWPEHFATLSSGRACVFFDEHEIGDFESITAAPEGRRRPFAFAARPLPADVPDATRLPVPS